MIRSKGATGGEVDGCDFVEAVAVVVVGASKGALLLIGWVEMCDRGWVVVGVGRVEEGSESGPAPLPLLLLVDDDAVNGGRGGRSA